MSNATGSTAQNPDLDWSQVRETINLLTLAVAQIEATMTDGDRSVNKLSDSFTTIASAVAELGDLGSQLNPDQHNEHQVDAIQGQTHDVRTKVNDAIVAIQFFDRLAQRLHHIQDDLRKLSTLIGDSSKLYNPDAWRTLQATIADNYTMEEERLMYEQIMRGATVEQALEIYRHHFESKGNDDKFGEEVELF